MATPVAPNSPAAETDDLWREITLQFREACILRRQGRHAASTAILNDTLPPLIRRWSLASPLASADAKARLQKLFVEEQERVDGTALLARFTAPADTAPAPATPAPAASRVLTAFPSAPSATWYPPIAPRRIRIDDVSDMIDAVREHDRLSAQRRPAAV